MYTCLCVCICLFTLKGKEGNAISNQVLFYSILFSLPSMETSKHTHLILFLGKQGINDTNSWRSIAEDCVSGGVFLQVPMRLLVVGQ